MLIGDNSQLACDSDESIDTRFSFTDWERASVQRLRLACLEKGIRYISLFELVKYVLVVESSVQDSDEQADAKRLQIALSRIQKRRAWEKRHGLDQIDGDVALQQLLEAKPKYFAPTYLKDKEGHNVVGHNIAHSPPVGTKDKDSIYLAAEQRRWDLAAADMNEARRGMALVCVANGELTVFRAMRYLRLTLLARENLSDMHCNRIRRVYAEVPSFLTHFISPAKRMLPRKINDRLTIVGNLAELEDSFIAEKDDALTLTAWMASRKAIHDETLSRLTLDDL